MPHLPATWKERKDADRERRVDRVMSDRLFQWTRTTMMRRVLVVTAAALCVAIIPAFVLGGGVIGVIVTIAAWAAWGLLRLSIRTVADLPDRFLDERQRALRNRSCLYAYLILGWTIAGLASVGLIAFVLGSENDAATLTITWDQAIGSVLALTLAISLLPSMVVAWLDRGEEAADVNVEMS
jgi:hypothetical protein